MLLVVGLLLALASMLLPSVMRLFNQQKITEATEHVRAAIAGARFRAIDTGLIYQFCCEANGTRFAVVPFEPDHLASSPGQQSAPIVLQGRAVGALPKGIKFSSVMVKLPGATTTATHKIAATAFDGLPNAGDLSSLNWSPPILFHPEGSANADAEVIVSDNKNQSIHLRIRAFTGAVTVGRLVSEKRK